MLFMLAKHKYSKQDNPKNNFNIIIIIILIKTQKHKILIIDLSSSLLVLSPTLLNRSQLFHFNSKIELISYDTITNLE